MAVDFVVDAVMTALGLEGNEFQRPTIEFYVDEVNEYLKDAGVPEDVIGTKPTVGIVARGVADLWSYGAGNGKLSVYFKERAIQLATADEPTPTPTPGGELPPITPADNGKVLTVVNGEWNPAAIPNGFSVVNIRCMLPDNPGSYTGDIQFTTDKTYNEIYAEYEAGKKVLFVLRASNSDYELRREWSSFAGFCSNDGSAVPVFTASFVIDDNIQPSVYYVNIGVSWDGWQDYCWMIKLADAEY